MMQIVYTLNFIVKEYRVTSTFYWHSEGVGYLQTVSSALYPFYFTTLSKHVSDMDLTFSTNVLITASLLYLLGYCLMLVSNDIKYEFRRNSLQPSLACKLFFFNIFCDFTRDFVVSNCRQTINTFGINILFAKVFGKIF